MVIGESMARLLPLLGNLYGHHCIEFGHSLFLNTWRYMGVQVQSDRDGTVPESLLHHLGMDFLGKQLCCVAVTQFVEGDAGEPTLFKN